MGLLSLSYKSLDVSVELSSRFESASETLAENIGQWF